MKNIKEFQELSSLKAFAKFISYSPKGLSYILYKIDNNSKYKTFNILKSNGNYREIKAPREELKRLQTIIAKKLSLCYEDICRGYRPLSHGFRKGYSIITNAQIHKNRRYIFNIDLKDFFPSLNFGRVRGFFIKSNHFGLNKDVATILAQICCHDNELPQGAPTSPIVSNLIAHIFDIKMVGLAKKEKCTYSRYADDVTFSTNSREFSKAIAFQNQDALWVPGKELLWCIDQAGFELNNQKTSMQYKTQRQIVTGLIVNKKVNIKREHYRSIRSMCFEFFKYDNYYIRHKIKKGKYNESRFNHTNNRDILRGHLDYACNVKKLKYIEPSQKNNYQESDSLILLYKDFIFFDLFYRSECPVVICEGKTDAVYFKHALKYLTNQFPLLANCENGSTRYKVKFFLHSRKKEEKI